MLITDLKFIGNNLYRIRRSKGLTQSEVAERADLSDRTYADIERGDTTMRIDTLLKICAALRITPNDILVDDELPPITEEQLLHAMNLCSPAERATAFNLLSVYLNSLNPNI